MKPSSAKPDSDKFVEAVTAHPVVNAVNSVWKTKGTLDTFVIPKSWRRHILTNNGSAHIVACECLSDIVYWYRPSSKLEEPEIHDGAEYEYKQKFGGKIYRLIAERLAEQLGYSSKTVRRALMWMEEIGLIMRHSEDVAWTHTVCMLWVVPNVYALNHITYNTAIGTKDLSWEEDCEEYERMREYDRWIEEAGWGAKLEEACKRWSAYTKQIEQHVKYGPPLRPKCPKAADILAKPGDKMSIGKDKMSVDHQTKFPQVTGQNVRVQRLEPTKISEETSSKNANNSATCERSSSASPPPPPHVDAESGPLDLSEEPEKEQTQETEPRDKMVSLEEADQDLREWFKSNFKRTFGYPAQKIEETLSEAQVLSKRTGFGVKDILLNAMKLAKAAGKKSLGYLPAYNLGNLKATADKVGSSPVGLGPKLAALKAAKSSQAPVPEPPAGSAEPVPTEPERVKVIVKAKAKPIAEVYEHEYNKVFAKPPEEIQDNGLKYWLHHFEEMAAQHRLPVQEVIRRAIAAYFRKYPVGSCHPLSFESFLVGGLTLLQLANHGSISEWKAFCSDLLKVDEKPADQQVPERQSRPLSPTINVAKSFDIDPVDEAK